MLSLLTSLFLARPYYCSYLYSTIFQEKFEMAFKNIYNMIKNTERDQE